MSDNSPTDNGQEPLGADNSALPENPNTNAAEEHTDTGSGGDSRDSGRDDDANHDGGSDSSSDSSNADDDGLRRFAESQGFDYENTTETERKALKLAHDNQKAFRQKSQADSSKLQETAVSTAGEEDDFDNLDDDAAEIARDRKERAEDRAERRTQRFYMQNPEAMDYDTEMAEIVQEELDTNGRQAAQYLASDLSRLLVLAKARRGDSDRKAEIEAARREERESFRQKQEASSGTPAAQSSTPRNNKVTREWLNTEYDPGNEDHRKMVDEALARGDLY